MRVGDAPQNEKVNMAHLATIDKAYHYVILGLVSHSILRAISPVLQFELVEDQISQIPSLRIHITG